MRTKLGKWLWGWRLGLCLAGLAFAGVLGARLTLRADEPGEFTWPYGVGAQSPMPQEFSFPAAWAAAEAETGMDLNILGTAGAWGEIASDCHYLVPLEAFGGAEPPPQIRLDFWFVLAMGGYAAHMAYPEVPGFFGGIWGGFAVYAPGGPVLLQWGSREAPDPEFSAGLEDCYFGGGWFLGNAYVHVWSPDFQGQSAVENPVSWWEIAGLIRYAPIAPPNQPPVARASADKTVVAVGQSVQFRGDQSTDPEGAGLTYFWEFGDGANSTDANPTHTYSEPNNYTVRLTVHDPQSGAGEAYVGIMAVGVSFDKNPVIVGVSKTKTEVVTATISPAAGFPYVSFSVADPGVAGVDPAAAASAAQQLTVSGVKKGMTILEARVNGAACGSTAIKVGFVDFVRITPDPGYLVPGQQTTFTAVGFATVQGYPPLPGSYSPDLGTSVGAVVVAAVDGKETRGVFLGPVAVIWWLEGGPNAEAFIPAGIPTENVTSVQVEASLEAEGDITPDLHCVMPDGAADSSPLNAEEILVDFPTGTEVTGYTLPPEKSKLAIRVEVRVRPVDRTPQVRLETAGTGASRITIEEESRDPVKGTIVLRILGRSATPETTPKGDTIINALIGGKVRASMNVLVVIPKFQKHAVFGQTEQRNSYFVNPILDGHNYLGTYHYKRVRIDVSDQFHNPLAFVYDNSSLEERFDKVTGDKNVFPPNAVGAWATMTLVPEGMTRGQFVDPVGTLALDLSNPDPTTKAIEAWVKGPPPQANISTAKKGTAEQRLRVAGHELSNVFRRDLDFTPPDNVKVADKEIK